MLDERSSVWVKLFKIYTLIITWLFALATLICAIAGLTEGICITEEPALDGLILLVGGAIITVSQLLGNMLIIQLLNNVLIIRDKVEKM